MDVKDYYKILGVGENASAQEIRSAYRRLAKQYHPDKNPGNSKAEEMFKSLSEAYDVLGDPGKKTKYDQMRKYGFGSGRSNASDFDFGSFRQAGRSTGPGGFTFEGFDFFGDLGNIFNLFGGKNPFRETRRRPQRGQDIHVEVRIPLEKMVRGGKTTFSIKKEDTCPSCEGGGAKPGSTVKMCPQCHGRGTIMSRQSIFGSAQACPRCGGKGQLIENPCNRCEGKGVAVLNKTYSVNIPAGVIDGEQIRLKNQGQKDPSGLPPGDLYVMVKLNEHRFFERRGRDVYCKVKINDSQASRGTTIKIKTVHGDKVRLKIPAGVKDGTTLRIPHMGFDKNGRGDQFVTIQIVKAEKKAG